MRKAGCWTATVAVLCVFAGHASSASAAFPGENGTIAFSSSQFVGGENLNGTWTIAPDGSGQSLLIEEAFSAAWSADGSKLVYVRASNEQFDVYTSNADGSGELRLTDDAHNDSGPAWSPDGTRIAWASDRSGSVQIWTMRADGADLRQLTSHPSDRAAFEPDWSPAGDSIAYWVRFGDDRSVRLVNADGSGDRGVTAPGFDGTSPDWAPDGSRLVFVSWEEHIGGALYTVRPDGTDQQRIPNLQGQSFGGADGMGIRSPAFSPDGTTLLYSYIVCFIGRCGEGIVIAPADGSEKRTLTAGVRFEGFGAPDWQPLIPNHPPDCAGVGADPSSLWPPNKHLRAVSLSAATDPDGDAVTLRVTGVTHDEGGAAGWQAAASDDQVQVRAERDAKGDGRVYTIAFEATDEHGVSCAGETTVTVPRHKW
jgi:hypothetical protein